MLSSSTSTPEAIATAARTTAGAPGIPGTTHKLSSLPPAAARPEAHGRHSSAVTLSRRTGSAPFTGYASSHQRPDTLRSSYEGGGGAVPVRKIRRHIDTEQQHDCQVREHREERRRVRQAPHVCLAEHHGLHATENRGERDAQ